MSHTRIRSRASLVAALSAVLASAALIGPASASGAATGITVNAQYQPDGRISAPCVAELEDCTRTWSGNNIYNTTAKGQVARYVDYPNFFDVVPVVFRIKIQNDGTAVDRFRVAAAGRTEGYRVRFFAGTTDITRQVRAGTYRTPLLAPGAKFLIKARVKPVDPTDGDKTTRLITLKSLADPTRRDSVKLVRQLIEVTCGC